MAINIPLSTLCITNGEIDKKVIKLVLDKIAQMGFIDCSFDGTKRVFKAGYKMPAGSYHHLEIASGSKQSYSEYGIHHTNLIGISDNYVYINPFDRQHELIDYLNSIRSIIREDSIDSIIYQ
jgi:hypothetical protein